MDFFLYIIGSRDTLDRPAVGLKPVHGKDMQAFVTLVDEATKKRERDKARALRQSQWWKNQLGKGRCYYCGRSFPPNALTMDHKTPIIRGGRSTKNNLVACCKPCNNEKKHRLLSEWVAIREQEGRPLDCARHELY